MQYWTGTDGHPNLFDDQVMVAAAQLLHTLIDLIGGDNVKLPIECIYSHVELGPQASQDSAWLNAQRWFTLIQERYDYQLEDFTDPSSRVYEPNALLWNPFKDSPGFIELDESPPLVRAILLRSLPELDQCISDHPEELMEKVAGISVLQLSVLWPEGLERLLATEARNLLYEMPDKQCAQALPAPLILAIKHQVGKSVDMLMKARCGTNIHIHELMTYINKSTDCLEAFITTIVERRRDLLSIARQELNVLADHDPVSVLDSQASKICQALAKASVSIDPSLQVDPTYSTIYHAPPFGVARFPMFLDRGFRDYGCCDAVGLTPLMVPHSPDTWPVLLKHLPWLEIEGFLGHHATDVLGLGLNTSATDWHYLGAYLGRDVRGSTNFDTYWAMAEKFSKLKLTDKCVCWCNFENMGCSPLKMTWKVYQHNMKPSRTVHGILHHGTNPTESGNEFTSPFALELVRLLTFEALDMKHTCCMVRDKANFLQSHGLQPQYKYPAGAVILNRDVREVQSIRSDEQELEKAELLDFLMEEFSQNLGHVQTSRALEGFFWGYWRRRISRLYAVDVQNLQQMEQVLSNVKTFVLPAKVRALLGPQFSLLKNNGKGGLGANGDALLEVENDGPPTCNKCPKQAQLVMRG